MYWVHHHEKLVLIRVENLRLAHYDPLMVEHRNVPQDYE